PIDRRDDGDEPANTVPEPGAMPPSSPEPAPDSVGEMVPRIARTRAVPVRRTEPRRRLRPGDLICGECGEGNLPTRKFCSRCGGPLTEAAVVRAPWWRRLLPRRGPKVMKAGTRPGKSATSRARPALTRINRRIRAVIALIVLVLGTLYGLYPPFRTAVNTRVAAVKQKITGAADQQLVPEHPVSVTDNAELPGHPGRYAVDEFKNTYWLASWSPNKKPTLTLNFGKHIALRKMIIMLGASDNFTAHDRPAALHLLFSNSESDDILPQDTPTAQQFTLSGGVGITSVQIQVDDVHEAQGASDVAITEIELFGIG
ncbi:MAG TPA: hypothetical protein VHF06_05480, partial [Pseudonocardiaceae bacterium]|nr:hypothetical protein [Pseudonocardiaceae bacterium]